MTSPLSALHMKASDYYKELTKLESNKVYDLNWVYKNELEVYGGWMTVDGPVNTLFDGKKISYIWKGEISIAVQINTK